MHTRESLFGPTSKEKFVITESIRIPREQHPISRKHLSPGSLKVLYSLKDAGFEAYLVGGAVRDLLAGIEPKDFDIATSAKPEEIRRVFRSCRLVGRRFLIAHVRVASEVLEVTTFRGPITDSHERDETGRILSDNIYGSLEQDALRRDFTVNALYYDIRDFTIVDFADGIKDLQARKLRLIGDPELRYREDPVRMLRAIRIANKLRYDIDEATGAPIARLANLLREIPPARLFDEMLKLFLSRDALENLAGLRRYGLFLHLVPLTDEALDSDPLAAALINRALQNTASRIENDQPVTPAFLYAAMLWPAYTKRVEQLQREQGHVPVVAQNQAAEEVIAHQQLRIAIPKRFSMPMREIWALQPRFDVTQPARVKRLLAHPRFRAAYDFLLLRGEAGEPGKAELGQWWTQAQKGGAFPPAFRDSAAVPSSEAEAVESDEFDEPLAETLGEDHAGAPSGPKRRRRRRGGRGRNRPGVAATGGAWIDAPVGDEG